MVEKIPPPILMLYEPLSLSDAFYLRMRWRLCPFELLESCVPAKGRILDFGCGYGILSNLLAERSKERTVIGIDLNPQRIAVARRSLAGRSNIDFRLGDVESLDPSPFDAVVMTDVLHHLDDREASILLGKVHKCLRTGGLFALLDVDRTPFWKFCVTYAIDTFLNPNDRLWYRPLHRIQKVLEESGLRTVKVIRAHKGLPLADVLLLVRKQGSMK